ncbi:HpcH/HpaI aldolase/citrate lyase family protein [Mycolicibacterium vaccae]|uniref:Citryl-CoA lyase n=1 Tax=Mycolicibacterium vaccae ATCC 25954 TaxID=1194972 RepID=K0UQC0_MYCVA|nr:aldolase/citrate lyase family protein [Mycolicibacterium vaccae]ANI39997.1 citrate lyase [Mycolicibacterium vaccae 95051]EJZ09036.1 citryl-CoA lyase [Mycolicibacterium vaccae ATCC 25954]MCV7063354.1 CoA ester lyase [Mycolicibacterium vaccae]
MTLQFDPAKIRSYFYVPAGDENLVAAAFDNEADAVVFDLEDLTPPDRKDIGRKLVSEVITGAPPKPVLVRVNAVGTGYLDADLDAIVGPGLSAIRVAKSVRADEVRLVAKELDRRRATAGITRVIGLQVMVETAAGVLAVPELAAADHLVESIGLGEGDLKKDLGTTTDEGLFASRAQVVLAARAAGLPGPVQVTFPPGGDADALRASTELGRRLGYTSRTLLNPAHIPVVNEIYG